MPKSPDAFRTISEVADWLGIQAHVLRFWESKFTQVKPIKRAGGRRYYRPNDMLLLGGIRQLLHEDGLTIKGVQKILREEGMSHVASLSQPLDELTQSQLEDGGGLIEAPMQEAAPVQESAVVLNFDSAPAREPVTEVPTARLEKLETAGHEVPDETPDLVTPEAEHVEISEPEDTVGADDAPAPEPETDIQETLLAELEAPDGPETTEPTPVVEKTVEAEPVANVEETLEAEQALVVKHTENPVEEDSLFAEEAPAAAKLPAFLRRPLAEETPPTDNPPADAAPAGAETVLEGDAAALDPKPRIIDMPTITPIDQIPANPAMLTAAFRTRSLSKTQADQIAPLLDRLTTLRDSMAASRSGGKNAGSDA